MSGRDLQAKYNVGLPHGQRRADVGVPGGAQGVSGAALEAVRRAATRFHPLHMKPPNLPRDSVT